jgi:hypothetical protein
MPTGTSHGKCPSQNESFSVVTLTLDNVGLTSENVDNSMDARNHESSGSPKWRVWKMSKVSPLD